MNPPAQNASPNDAEPDDNALMRRVKSGDTEAFGLLCARYRPGLRAFFAALLPREARDSADDMAQETLLRLWLARHKWEPTGNFSAYVFQIGRHYFFNQRTRVRARAACEISTAALENGGDFVLLGPARTQPEAVLLLQWEAARLQNAVNELPPRLREVFVLREDGATQKEIACRLGIPVGTVKSRLFDAVRHLRARLAADEETPKENK